MARRNIAYALAAIAVAGFTYTLFLTPIVWFWRHQDPEAIAAPVSLTVISIFAALFAFATWRRKSFAWLAGIGGTLCVAAIVLESALYR